MDIQTTTSFFDSPAAAADSRSILVMGAQASWVYIYTCSFGLLSSLATIAIILRNRNLRTSVHHWNVVHVSFASAVYCVSTLGLNLRRVTVLGNNGTDFTTTAACATVFQAMYISGNAQKTQHMAIAICRVAALLVPLRYSRLTVGQAQWINAAGYLFVTVIGLAQLSGLVDAPVITACVYGRVYKLWVSPAFRPASDFIKHGTTALIALVPVTLIFMRCKGGGGEVQGQSAAVRRLMAAASRNCGIILIAYVSCVTIPTMLVEMLQNTAAALAAGIVTYLGFSNCVDPILNLVLFLAFDSMFRKAARDSWKGSTASSNVHSLDMHNVSQPK